MKKMEKLKKQVCRANKSLVEAGLVVLTWGNVSGRDRGAEQMIIKPSGVDYARLTPEKMVGVFVESGETCGGDMAPSSDSPTHLELYRAFDALGGIVHTHSPYATAWAQAARPIPCLGTTHADTFYGDIPVSRQLSEDEVESDYELNAGKAIVECFTSAGRDPLSAPAVLVPGHGPFVWGENTSAAVENAIVVEQVARLASLAMGLQTEPAGLPEYIMKKHFSRKHGPDAYYGQK